MSLPIAQFCKALSAIPCGNSSNRPSCTAPLATAPKRPNLPPVPFAVFLAPATSNSSTSAIPNARPKRFPPKAITPVAPAVKPAFNAAFLSKSSPISSLVSLTACPPAIRPSVIAALAAFSPPTTPNAFAPAFVPCKPFKPK